MEKQTLNEKLQLEAEKLTARFDINYQVALEIVTAGADVAIGYFWPDGNKSN